MIYVLLYIVAFGITFISIVVVGKQLVDRYYDNKMNKYLDEYYGDEEK